MALTRLTFVSKVISLLFNMLSRLVIPFLPRSKHLLIFHGCMSPLNCTEIKPVNPKGNQSWIFVGRTDVEVETPKLWPSDAKNWLIGKDPDAGKDWGQEEKGTTEDEMVGWHHQCNGWVWVGSGSWWWTGKPCLLESMRSQTFRHDWAIEVNWNRTDTFTFSFYLIPPGANSNSQQLYQINQEGNSLIGTESSKNFGDF